MKIGRHCIAYIRARNYLSGNVEIEFCDHHLLKAQLAHLHIPESTKQMIAAKLHDGVSTNAILDCIQDNIHGKIGRAELVTRQDVHNIRH